MSASTTLTAEPGTQTVEITRDFDATPEQLLRAHTDPSLVARWLGPRSHAMHIDVFEPRDGGRYAYTHRAGDGEYRFRGVFHGEPSLDGLVQTFEYLGTPGIVSIDHLTFTPLPDGGTRLHGHSIFPTVEARDGIVAAGMERGVREGYERIEELLAEGAL